MSKIILFELNEVPLKIFHYYIKLRPNSWLAKNFGKFKKYETVTENQGHLSPWNTWPTLHRGVSNDKHYISEFNQNLKDVDQEFAPIWSILAENNIKIGVFGSLHTSGSMPKYMENYAFFVPDVFAPNPECFPNNVEIFQKINLNLSRESMRNVDSSIPLNDILNILFNINNLGITAKTIFSTGKQLVSEQINAWKVVRRRTYQTVLSFDVFFKLLKKNKPSFTTFFTNHVASSMHRYWPASFPDEYERLEYDSKWIHTYSNEILFTMDHTDKMLAKLSSFIDRNDDYKFIITSSMGQEAVECKRIETQLYLNKPNNFFRLLGVKHSDCTVLPAMLPRVNVRVNENCADLFENNLKLITINGTPLSYRKVKGDCLFSIDFGHENLKEISVIFKDSSYSLEESGLENIVIQDKSSSSAYHIPEGHLFSYHPSNPESDFIHKQLPTCDIVPILLHSFGIKPKSYMNKVTLQNL